MGPTFQSVKKQAGKFSSLKVELQPRGLKTMSIAIIDTGGLGVRPRGIEPIVAGPPSKDAADAVRRLRAKLEDHRRRRAQRAGWPQG